MEKFEVKIRYKKVSESGREIIARETYLIDAVSFTDAEAVITKEMESLTGGFEVLAIKRSNIGEVVGGDDECRYYKAKVVFESIDEDSGHKHNSIAYLLVNADVIENVRVVLNKALSEVMINWEVSGITESPIVDVLSA